MTKYEIVEILAKERAVETMLQNIAHQNLSADLTDLSQLIYLILLEYDDAKLQDLWENKEIKFFIAAIIRNQYYSKTSTFYRIFRKYKVKAEDITGKDWIDEN